VQALWAQIQTAGAQCDAGTARAQTVLRAAGTADQVTAEGRREIERIYESCVAAASSIHGMTPPPSIERAEARTRMQQAIGSCTEPRAHQQSAMSHVVAILEGQGDPQYHLDKIEFERSRIDQAYARCREDFSSAASTAGASVEFLTAGNSSR
jgi:hypothetical protein